jgi:hypothetical protein
MKMTKKEAKNALQGFWVFASDSSYSMAFVGDTLLEYHMGEQEFDLISFKLYNKSEIAQDSTEEISDDQGNSIGESGIYIVLEGDEEVAELTAALVFPDTKHLLLVLPDLRALELEKKF